MNSNSRFVKPSAFNVSSISYGKPVMDSRGGKKIPINNGSWKLSLQTPLMFTWGMNERVSEDTGRISYDINPVFQSSKSDSIAHFQEKIQALQDKILDDAVSNSKQWFGKSKMSREVAEAIFWPLLKYPKMKDADGNYLDEKDYSKDPTMKLKVPYWEGKFTWIDVYEMVTEAGKKAKPLWLNPDKCKKMDPPISPPQEDGQTPMDFMPKKTYIKAGIVCNGIWMSGGKFGVTWSLADVHVRLPVSQMAVGVSAIEYDEDDLQLLQEVKRNEVEELETLKQEEESSTNTPTFSSDAEDDEEEEEEVVVEPPKPVKKKKKVVRRKKKVASSE